MIEAIGEIYVFYIVPGFKFFLLIILTLGVFAFWSLIKNKDFLQLASEAFHGLVHYTYITLLGITMGAWFVIRGIGQVFYVIFATVRDFFVPRS